MVSQSDAVDGVQSGQSDSDTAAPGADDQRPKRYTCVVCQRPLDGDARWRGEPVHVECGAELRCGITLRTDGQ